MPKMERLSEDQISAGMEALPDWQREGDEITRTFELETFPAAIAFVDRVAVLAEEADHHPDLDIRYRRVRVALTTHDAGGLSRLDLDLAARIQQSATGSG